MKKNTNTFTLCISRCGQVYGLVYSISPRVRLLFSGPGSGKKQKYLCGKPIVERVFQLSVSAATSWSFWGMTPQCRSAGKVVDSSGMSMTLGGSGIYKCIRKHLNFRGVQLPCDWLSG